MNKRTYELNENTSPSLTHKIPVSDASFLEDKYMELDQLKDFTQPSIQTTTISSITLEGASVPPISNYCKYQTFGSTVLSFSVGVSVSWSDGDEFILTVNKAITSITINQIVSVDVIYNGVWQYTAKGIVTENTPVRIKFNTIGINTGGTFYFVVNENLL